MIPAEEKNRRYEKLLKVQGDIALQKNLPLVGRVERVLCDGESKTDKQMYSGRTDGNKIVFFKAEPSDKGQFIDIMIERAEAFALYGTKI